MPVYTYKCVDCQHVFETRQRMSAAPLTDCPVCDGSIRRVVSAVGIVFKGSGFYVTDSRNGKSKSTGDSVSVPKPESGESGLAKKKDASGTNGAEPATKKEVKAAKSSEAKT